MPPCPAAHAVRVLALALPLAIGCATRSVSRPPPSSPASGEAEAAPSPPVGVALREDPPLPGDAAARWEQWPGLSSETADAPAGHGGHDAEGGGAQEEAGDRRPPGPGEEHDGAPGGGHAH